MDLFDIFESAHFETWSYVFVYFLPFLSAVERKEEGLFFFFLLLLLLSFLWFNFILLSSCDSVCFWDLSTGKLLEQEKILESTQVEVSPQCTHTHTRPKK
jgi:hypothetical protein